MGYGFQRQGHCPAGTCPDPSRHDMVAKVVGKLSNAAVVGRESADQFAGDGLALRMSFLLNCSARASLASFASLGLSAASAAS